MGVRVLIPAYNEASTIGDVIKSIRSQGLDVLVIDDGSTDNTYDIAQINSASVIRHAMNKGKGASLREGFEDTLKKDYDAVIVMDGDGQHDPQEIQKFLKEVSSSDADIIVGNRMEDVTTMPFKRKMTNRFMSYLISKVAKQDIPDTQCGYRLIKTKALKSVKFLTSNYEIESELLIKASRKGFKISHRQYRRLRNQLGQGY